MPKLTKVCPECSASVNQICSRLVIDLFGLSNALFLDMLARFSSRLDMLLLGLSDALFNTSHSYNFFGDFTLQYVSNNCHPHKFVPMWHSAERFAPWCFIHDSGAWERAFICSH